MGWEYKVMQGDALPSEENLNELDGKGWELVQIIHAENTFYLYLRRPRKHH